MVFYFAPTELKFNHESDSINILLLTEHRDEAIPRNPTVYS